jgi:HEAT repeat protein
MGMRRWIFRYRGWARSSWLPIAALLYFAGALAVPPSAGTQEDTGEWISKTIRDLQSKNAVVRTRAAEYLGNSASPDYPLQHREQIRKAVPALMEALKDTDSSVRGAAASALGNIPGDMRVAVPALAGALQDKDRSVREAAALSLGRLGQSPELAVPVLVGMLNRDDNRESARDALIKLGPAARPAVPALIDMLNVEDPNLRSNAAQVLGAIGPDAQSAEPVLTSVMRGTDDQTRLEAADALGKIGRDQPEAVEVTTRILNAQEKDWFVRERAAAILGHAGPAAEASIPVLTNALNDENEDVRRAAARAISKIATALRDRHRTEAIEPLQKAMAAMQQSPDRYVTAQARAGIDAITTLQELRRHDVKWQILRPFHEHPRVAFAAGGYVALAFLWTCLLWLWPISLLKVSETLEPLPKLRLPGWLAGADISASHLLLVGFFSQSDRVLDAWVVRHLEKARSSFESNNVITGRADLIQGPMLLDRERLPALSVGALRPAFSRPRSCILIWGNDENRNKSLASQIARWSMELDPEKRLRKNLMLAVQVERNFVYAAEKNTDPFARTVRDKLQLEDETASMELVARLLKRQRVLVIVLGFSELNEPTQSSIQPGNADFPAHALVVTSRVEEALGGASKTVIQFCDEIRL